MKHFLVFLLLGVGFGGCKDSQPLPREMGTAYFPLKKGLYHIYAVEEVRYTRGSAPRSLRYEIKTEVADSFPSDTGELTYVIYRSRREDDSQPWEPLDTWSARRNDMRVIVSEGNTPFVRLTFPVDQGSRWNGNQFNTLGEDEYELTVAGQPREVNGMTFEKTITVDEERNEDEIVFHDVRSEIYALGVGLVYREIVQLHYCTDDACIGQQVIDDGVELTMEVKEYGDQ